MQDVGGRVVEASHSFMQLAGSGAAACLDALTHCCSGNAGAGDI